MVTELAEVPSNKYLRAITFVMALLFGTYTLENSSPLIRDFNCAFVPTGSSGVTEFHPFTNGSATFNISNYHPRTIDYGPGQDCDNTGIISFNNEFYSEDFD